MKDYSLYLTLLFLACLAFLIVRTRFIDGFIGGSDVELDLVPETNGSSSSSANPYFKEVAPTTNGSSSSSARKNVEIVLPTGSSSSSNIANILNNTGKLYNTGGSNRYQLPPIQISFIRGRTDYNNPYIGPESEETAAVAENTSPTVLTKIAAAATAVTNTESLSTQKIVGAALIAAAGAVGVYMFSQKM